VKPKSLSGATGNFNVSRRNRKLLKVAAGAGVLLAAIGVAKGALDGDSAAQITGGNGGGQGSRQQALEVLQGSPLPAPRQNLVPLDQLAGSPKAPNPPAEVIAHHNSGGGHENLTPWVDRVDPNDGPTQSFIDYAHEKGKNLSPARAFEFFNEAKDQGLISEDHLSNISSQNVIGGVGFKAPGHTTMSPELQAFLDSQLEKS
jgi:hypothetical protein